MFDVGDIIKIVDGSWATDQHGNRVNGVDIPQDFIIVGIDPTHTYPTNDNNTLPYHKKNNIKVSGIGEDTRIIYTRDVFCELVHKHNSIGARKLKLEKLENIS